MENSHSKLLNSCRLCMGKTENMYSIGSKATCMITKIKYCTGLQIDENDGLPQTICVICFNHVNIAHQLKKISLMTDKNLRLMLKEKSEYDVKDELRVSDENMEISYDEPVDELDDLIKLSEYIHHKHSSDVSKNDAKVEIVENHFIKSFKESEEIERETESASKKPINPNTKRKKILNKNSSQNKVSKRSNSKLKMPSGTEITKKVLGLKPEADEFKCEKCSLMFKTKAGLSLHVFREHEDKMVCEVCGKEYRDKASLTMHKQSHTKQKMFACPYCDHKSNYKSSLTQHIMIHKGEKRYKCEHCPAAFITAQDKRRHYNALHNPDVTLHACELCGKQFTAKYKLKRHFDRIYNNSVCKSETPKECEICHHVLASRGNYRRHMIKVHKLKAPPRYPKVAVIASAGQEDI